MMDTILESLSTCTWGSVPVLGVQCFRWMMVAVNNEEENATIEISNAQKRLN